MDVIRILGKSQSPIQEENDLLYHGNSPKGQMLNSGMFSFDRYFEGIRKVRKERDPPYQSSFGPTPPLSGTVTPRSLQSSPSNASKYFAPRASSIQRPVMNQETVQKIIRDKIAIRLPPLSLNKSKSQVTSKTRLHYEKEKVEHRPRYSLEKKI